MALSFVAFDSSPDQLPADNPDATLRADLAERRRAALADKVRLDRAAWRAIVADAPAGADLREQGWTPFDAARVAPPPGLSNVSSWRDAVTLFMLCAERGAMSFWASLEEAFPSVSAQIPNFEKPLAAALRSAPPAALGRLASRFERLPKVGPDVWRQFLARTDAVDAFNALAEALPAAALWGGEGSDNPGDDASVLAGIRASLRDSKNAPTSLWPEWMPALSDAMLEWSARKPATTGSHARCFSLWLIETMHQALFCAGEGSPAHAAKGEACRERLLSFSRSAPDLVGRCERAYRKATETRLFGASRSGETPKPGAAWLSFARSLRRAERRAQVQSLWATAVTLDDPDLLEVAERLGGAFEWPAGAAIEVPNPYAMLSNRDIGRAKSGKEIMQQAFEGARKKIAAAGLDSDRRKELLALLDLQSLPAELPPGVDLVSQKMQETVALPADLESILLCGVLEPRPRLFARMAESLRSDPAALDRLRKAERMDSVAECPLPTPDKNFQAFRDACFERAQLFAVSGAPSGSETPAVAAASFRRL
jgi:hypothetical protein